MSMVQCLNPTKCGVQSHIIGSEQERNCLTINSKTANGTGSIPSMKLSSGTSSSARDLSTETPAIIDEEIRNTENDLIDANWEIGRADDYEAKYNKATSVKRVGMERTLTLLVEERETAKANKERLTGELELLEDEYYARGGWPRYFHATNNNGHVHASTRCSTCNNGKYATSFSWKTSFSGKSEDEVVDMMGEAACTVCFPNAPAEARAKPYNMYTDEEKAERAQQEAERESQKLIEQAAVEDKGIWGPDGGPLRLKGSGYGGDVMKTQRSAEIRAVDRLSSVLHYNQVIPPIDSEAGKAMSERHATNLTNMSGMNFDEAMVHVKASWNAQTKSHPSTDEWLDDVERIINAVSSKTGERYEDVLLRFREKAITKYHRDGGEDPITPLDWILYKAKKTSEHPEDE